MSKGPWKKSTRLANIRQMTQHRRPRAPKIVQLSFTPEEHALIKTLADHDGKTVSAMLMSWIKIGASTKTDG